MRGSFVAGALVAVAVTAGCSAAPVSGAAVPQAGVVCTPPAAEHAFTDRKGRFAFVPPAGWKADESGRFGNDALFVSPTTDKTSIGPYAANISVRVVPVGDTTVAQAVAGIRQDVKSLNRYQPTLDEPMATGCLPGHLFGGTFTDLGSKLELQNLQAIAVHGGVLTVLTASSTKQNWDEHRAELEAAVRSLTVPV